MKILQNHPSWDSQSCQPGEIGNVGKSTLRQIDDCLLLSKLNDVSSIFELNLVDGNVNFTPFDSCVNNSCLGGFDAIYF